MGYTKDLWTKPSRSPDGSLKRDEQGKVIREPNSRWGKGKRWLACWSDPDGGEPTKAFQNKLAATRYWQAQETDVERGDYIDPKFGREDFEAAAKRWILSRRLDESSRHRYMSVLKLHLAPEFGKRSVKAVNDKPSDILAFLSGCTPSTRALAYHVLQGTLELAKLDGLIKQNKVRLVGATSRITTAVDPRTIWTDDQVWDVINALPDWLRILPKVGAGTGLREGELFGLAAEDIDEAGMWVHVRRQIKRIPGGGYVFALPKGGKVRKVPLSPGVLAAIDAHKKIFKPIPASLPWAKRDGKPETHHLIIHGDGEHLRTTVVTKHWNPALVTARLIPEPAERYNRGGWKYVTGRENGRHALRHYYASVELADGGEGRIKALSEWLGHATPTFTLEIYQHVLPDTEQRARSAVDERLFRPRLVRHGT